MKQKRPARYSRSLLAVGFLAFAFASPTQSQNGIALQWPMDCTLGSDCWIARYMDRSDAKGRLDYACGSRTQDAHNGTDIAVADMAAMRRGVSVLAAADGKVVRLRRGMSDQLLSREARKEISKQGCGNAVILSHQGGWETSYCHLKQDSILVSEGEKVVAGQPIASVGLSGFTEFPHLHFMVRAPRAAGQPRRATDPFDGGRFRDDTCDEANAPLWTAPMEYQAAAVLPPVIDTSRRSREDMWNSQKTTLSSTATSLIVQARGFHAQAGDIWRIRLMDPDGRIRVNQSIEQKQSRQRVQAFAGLKRPNNGFKAGRWSGSVELLRSGKRLAIQDATVLIE